MADPLKSDDRRAALVELRNMLADALRSSQTNPNVLPQIAARYQAVLDDIDALPGEVEQSVTDRVRLQREKRRQSA